MSIQIDWNETLEEIQRKKRAAVNLHAIRQEQCFSLAELSKLLNIKEEDLIVFENQAECSEDVFNLVIDWMMETLNKRPDC